jgi:hypothetical protein
MVSLANHHDEAWDLSLARGISESTTCIYTPYDLVSPHQNRLFSSGLEKP